MKRNGVYLFTCKYIVYWILDIFGFVVLCLLCCYGLGGWMVDWSLVVRSCVPFSVVIGELPLGDWRITAGELGNYHL